MTDIDDAGFSLVSFHDENNVIIVPLKKVMFTSDLQPKMEMW